jgi:choline dehydrogenase
MIKQTRKEIPIMLQNTQPLPRYADTVIVGGGSSGAVIAGRLAEQSDRFVLLLEAGPDYGSYQAGAWPQSLLDARTLPVGHDWNYASAAHYGKRGLALPRGRVLGGCSAVNGCAAIWGHRADYDAWERQGNPGWSTQELLPFFHDAMQQMRVGTPGLQELTPWHQAFLASAPGAGIPLVEDLNDLEQDTGAAASPSNISQGVRWNTAFAYLDPVRERSNLLIHGNVLVDRLVVQKGHVTGLEVIASDRSVFVEAGQVVLCAGTYGSPALLLRSGIGKPQDMQALGIDPVHALPGVGQNLHDHPAIEVHYAGTPDLVASMQAFVGAGGWLYEEQTLAKARSSLCQSAFDLHLYPIGGPTSSNGSSWLFTIPVAHMTPRSRGSLHISSSDPAAPPVIDHGYLTDSHGYDCAVLLDGIEVVRSLAEQLPLLRLVGTETFPGLHLHKRDELRTYVLDHAEHYYHPVGTCKMGPASDPLAVVDTCGQVHGLEGLTVADASIMPVIPRANTNIPCVVIGEKIASFLCHTAF